MTTDYEFLVSAFCICMYKNIRVWRLCAPGGRGPVCLAHSARPIATPLLGQCVDTVEGSDSHLIYNRLRF